jgi:hypothetical protein
MEVECLPCHSPGSQEASQPFLTYNEVFAQRTAILSQVYGCLMPCRDRNSLLQRSARSFSPGSSAAHPTTKPTEHARQATKTQWTHCRRVKKSMRRSYLLAIKHSELRTLVD